MKLAVLLAELHRLDQELATGDLEALAEVVPRRAELIAAIAAAIPHEPALPSYATMLRASLEAGMAAQRGILVARHQMAQQMAEIGQRQRLSSDLAQQRTPPPQPSRIDFSA